MTGERLLPLHVVVLRLAVGLAIVWHCGIRKPRVIWGASMIWQYGACGLPFSGLVKFRNIRDATVPLCDVTPYVLRTPGRAFGQFRSPGP